MYLRKCMLNTDHSPELSVTIAGVVFKNPVIAASGTFGYGREYGELFDVSRLGGICTKGLTLRPRRGSSIPSAWKIPASPLSSNTSCPGSGNWGPW
jgi:dihydroorotate dehydrogenase (NAD+) catalytic subunit